MKLYYKAGACSLSPHIALLEAGFKPELIAVDLQTKLTEKGEDFNTINPKGYIPALVTDSGETLTEGVVITQYVADLKPEKNLAPANGTIARLHLQEWLNYISTELHKNFGGIFNAKASPDWKAASIANLEKRYGYVNEQLKGKSYLMGDQFSVADGYLFTTMRWAKVLKPELLATTTELNGFFDRVNKRPAVQEALKAEGLI